MMIIGANLAIGNRDRVDVIIKKQSFLNKRLQKYYEVDMNNINISNDILSKLYSKDGKFIDFNLQEYKYVNPVDSLKSLSKIFKESTNLFLLEF